jgi:hypothetical protein
MIAKAERQRSSFVTSVFENKSKWQYTIKLHEATPYKEMSELIQEHVAIISKSEKDRLLRERIHFEKSSREFERNKEEEARIMDDTADNLSKMLIHIC